MIGQPFGNNPVFADQPATLSGAPASHDPRFLATEIERILQSQLDSQMSVVASIDENYLAIVEHLSSFILSGGKRLRPLFAWCGWLIGRPESAGLGLNALSAQSTLRACAALEFVQACALIHDDIIDASTIRRGKATMHCALASEHDREQWLGSPTHYGLSQAILLGDLALSWADDMLVDAIDDTVALRRVLPAWSAMKTEVLGGQILDVRAESVGSSDFRTAETINRFKTAAYTVERPLHIGAAMAGAGTETILRLRQYGVAIGTAFQLRDDLLGVFGDPQKTGKPTGDDIREGKQTVLIAEALRLSNSQNGSEILNSLGKGAEADVDAVRALLTECGAVTAVEDRITALEAESVTVLDEIHMDEDTRTFVDVLTGAALRRVT